jgi:hypothetical protein
MAMTLSERHPQRPYRLLVGGINVGRVEPGVVELGDKALGPGRVEIGDRDPLEEVAALGNDGRGGADAARADDRDPHSSTSLGASSGFRRKKAGIRIAIRIMIGIPSRSEPIPITIGIWMPKSGVE